ncbi:glycosyltransferase 87 family protein [Nocardia wallacei]|uniref:glycosyltransferase 87 family protein n=1 Tax=Nocardia wallacei TaxID=480035 RepID=UPI002454569C|nr:glycosyltransferase 87 family protein [Nocardia wallacei]
MSAGEAEDTSISRRAGALALAAGVAGPALHAVLIPFTAPPRLGLLNNGMDLVVYREGAQAVADAHSLYSGLPDNFTYPPFAALVFLPLTFVTEAIARHTWFALSCVALLLTVWRCLRVLGYRRDRATISLCIGLSLLAIEIDAVRGALTWGQISIGLMAILIYDLTRPPGARWRGWSVGVAAGMKLMAVVILPYLLLTRQWRAAGVAAGVAAATVLAGFVLLPGDSREYWTHTAYQVERIGHPDDVTNRSVNGVLANLYSPGSVPTWAWLICAGLAGIVGLLAAVLAHRRGWLLLPVTILGMAACVVSPLAWGHQWVWFVPLLILLLHQVISQIRSGARIFATATVACLVAMWEGVWTYARTRHLHITPLVEYSRTDIAVGRHNELLRILICGYTPLLYLTVAVATIVYSRDPMRRSTAAPESQSAASGVVSELSTFSGVGHTRNQL